MKKQLSDWQSEKKEVRVKLRSETSEVGYIENFDELGMVLVTKKSFSKTKVLPWASISIIEPEYHGYIHD